MPEVQPERDIEENAAAENEAVELTESSEEVSASAVETEADIEVDADADSPEDAAADEAPQAEVAETAPAPEATKSAPEAKPAPEEPEEEDDGRRRRPWPQARLEAALEAMLFASPDVLGFRQLRSILPDDQVTNEAIRAALGALRERYDEAGHGIQLVEISGGWQFQTRPEHFDYVGALAKTRIEEKVTPAALETLALIAYKQPITRAEVDAIRGVGSGQLIRTLMDKNMVKVVGRVELPGRPFQYGTTKQFLVHFGLKNLKDLPRGRDL